MYGAYFYFDYKHINMNENPKNRIIESKFYFHADYHDFLGKNKCFEKVLGIIVNE